MQEFLTVRRYFHSYVNLQTSRVNLELMSNGRSNEVVLLLTIQGVPGGMCQISGGCSLC